MVVSKLEMIPAKYLYWSEGYLITRIVKKFQTDDVIYILMAYGQIKLVRILAVKNGDVRCTCGAAESNTVLFLVRNDTTPYFTVSKTT